MPKNLEKLKKKISKKKGNITSLNENSRDSQRLRRAGARGEKLEKLAAARAKANQPHSAHAALFHDLSEDTHRLQCKELHSSKELQKPQTDLSKRRRSKVSYRGPYDQNEIRRTRGLIFC